MSDLRPEDFDEIDDEEMTVSIFTDDGEVVCGIDAIFDVDGRSYIALLPLDEDENETEEVWFYRYSENPDDPNEEPQIDCIDDDDEYEAVLDKYDELQDEIDFDNMK